MCSSLWAQKCNFVLSGVVTESSDNQPIVDVYVFLEELSIGVTTNNKGEFLFSKLCKGSYHIDVSHIGCENKKVYVNLDRSKTIEVSMEHYVEMLDGVHLQGHKLEKTTQSVQKIKAKDIHKNAHQNLGGLLEGLAGVSIVKNGSGISKPVVHGLTNSRIIFLNNGVVQSGQQWGNDHSPEIDPLMSQNIKLIKGVGALEYQGNSLGSVVMASPKKIGDDPHIHGIANTFYETNGRGHGANLSLEKANRIVDWRVNGTFKKAGDSETPDYFLNNTGINEKNIALQLRKKWSSKWLSKLYFSSFNTEIGILRGAQSGTEAVLKNAFIRQEPFFTEDDFSYELEAPRQEVHHHLLKLETRYDKNEYLKYDFQYAGQSNLRKEFDVRRSGRSKIPSLEILQNTHHLSFKRLYHKGDVHLKSGIQYTFTDNTNNNTKTGTFPLIPDYLSHQVGVFTVYTKKIKRWLHEFGGRYNYSYQDVANLVRGTQEVNRFQNHFHNISVASGLRYRTLSDLHFAFNIGLTSRNPDVNELYSNGLHQGVASFEIGNPDLQKEVGIKTTFGVEGQVAQKWFFETLAYYQYIDNYIFIDPSGEINVSIRGSFPVFNYRQTNAEIFGLDLGTSYQINNHLKLGTKYSFLRGNNLSENVPLVNMPANNLFGSIDYQLGKIGKFTNTNLGLNYKYVWRQNHLNDNQDFVPPPKAYQLIGAKIETNLNIGKIKWFYYASATNLLNIRYRDYLNRLRYFADERGRSVVLGLRAKF
ncbi:TonB-dependent receptor [Wenyingzhuangia sp. IMCC45533]